MTEPTPIHRQISHHMSADTVLSDIYDLCETNLMCSKTHHWHITAFCAHGSYKSESISGSDLTQALIKIYSQMEKAHSKK